MKKDYEKPTLVEYEDLHSLTAGDASVSGQSLNGTVVNTKSP